jgi:Toprim-like
MAESVHSSVMVLRPNDPPAMPDTGETPNERWSCASSLVGTAGQTYIERRGIPIRVAQEADVRYDPDWHGRPAVIVPMKDSADVIRSVHGRYIQQARHQDKMFTIGPGGGVVSVLGGWRHSTIILVEGLFDALSLALCGYGSVATIGRWAPWLSDVCAHKVVWLAFDSNRPGEIAAARYSQSLTNSELHRLLPPGRSKDWNTALVKRDRGTIEAWLQRRLSNVKPL